ncbi:DEAD/DEAH box helicase [Sulfolobus acidocaldarius]|uniref:ATP-dependent helicase n=1 Tax=Sulfolobus acidocaldarius TaxID=2285 RepID=A0A0U3GR16_9CREN|nr:DEAD/DEAH box helicase [Sulfolobus acidocaldarius]ALU32757.1 ATP-dependent helicase [Sulfolobus acidocaldarius]
MDKNDLSYKLLSLIREKGWDDLTSIQKKTLSPILLGKNVLIIAPTGYGKTEAALLPIFNSMLNDTSLSPVALLYITPLKALINDLTHRIDWWASKLGFIVSRKHGEVPQKEKSIRLKRVPHILDTTPEGLEVDLDWATKFRENYKNIKWVVIDEVHELVHSKRGAQLSVLLERLKEYSGNDFQRIGLSATISNEKKVAQLLFGSSQRDFNIIKVSSNKNFELKIHKVEHQGETWTTIAKTVINKIEKPTLLFTNSRFSTERLFEELEKYNIPSVFVHHSSISRDDKNKVEENLREGRANLVICTRTLELGIHVGDVKKVIMYRPPPSVSSFLQRLGRSGHLIDHVSCGEILCLYDHEVIESLALSELAMQGKLESGKVMPFLDVVAREAIGIALQYGEVDVNRLYSIISSSTYFRALSFEEFLKLIEYLANNNLLKVEGNRVKVGKTFFKIWSFNKNNKLAWMKDFSEFFSFVSSDETFLLRFENKTVGEIDAIYVYKHLRNNDTIRISGKLWRIVSIDLNKMTITVVPANDGEGEIPIWKGENVSRSNLLPKKISKVIRNYKRYLDLNIINNAAKNDLKNFVNFYLVHGLPLPNRKTIYVEKDKNEIIYATLINEKVSNTLAHLLLYLATKDLSLNVSVRSSIYGFSIRGVENDLMSEIVNMNEDELRKLIIKSIMRSPLFYTVLKEIKYSFGKIGNVSLHDDKLLIKEAIKQTVYKYFSIKNTLKYIKMIKNKDIDIIHIEGISPLGRAVLNHTPLRPWITDLSIRIYQAMKGGAYTVSELSEMLGISEKSLESRLKKMRKYDSKYRTCNFIDIDTKDMRWVLLEDFEEIVETGDYYNSFEPIKLDETYVAVIRPINNEGNIEIVFRVKELVENPENVTRRIPYDEVFELKLKDPSDPLVMSISPRYYFVNKNVIKFLILNAVSYIQNTRFG